MVGHDSHALHAWMVSKTLDRRSIGLVIVVLALASPAAADRIQLRPRADTEGPQVYLGDIADLEGRHAEALVELVVAQFKPKTTRMTISLAALRKRLRAKQINVATISLVGFAKCQVVRHLPPPAPIVAETTAPIVANSIDDLHVDGPTTLREHFDHWLPQHLQLPSEEIVIELSTKEIKSLAVSAQRDRFEFQLHGQARLGKLAITINRFSGQELVERIHVRPMVKRQRMAVVVKDRIKAGEPYTSDNVELRQVQMDRDRGQPVEAIDQVIGMMARSTVKPGAMLFEKDLRKPYLVRKGQLITARCIAGNLMVKTVGRAEADGALDDIVMVRNEQASRGRKDPKATYFIRVTGRNQGMVTEGERGFRKDQMRNGEPNG